MTLAPGERAEIVVDLTNETETLMLISNAVYEKITLLRFVKNILAINRDENEVFKILEIRPRETHTESMPLPSSLNKIENLKTEIAVKRRRFILDPDNHTINGKKSDHQQINEVIHSGDVEIWEISNQSGTYHPFHIHAVQFLILDRNGKLPADYEQGWKDTVLVHNAETVRVIMRFPEYSDSHLPFMYHCHILEHEDMGMMGQFVVVNKSTRKEDIYIQGDTVIDGHDEMHHQ